jgi:hypothetical protein
MTKSKKTESMTSRDRGGIFTFQLLRDVFTDTF